MNTRSTELELLDLGHYTPEEYEDCLIKLDQIGRYLGGDQATYWGFRQIEEPIHSILDVGCGGGLFTMRLAEKYPAAKVLGIDLDPNAIAFAKKHLKPNLPVRFEEGKDLSEGFDVVTCTLVCHHMSDDDLIGFLQKATSVAKKGVVINDLHRHPLAYYSFKGGAPLSEPFDLSRRASIYPKSFYKKGVGKLSKSGRDSKISL